MPLFSAIIYRLFVWLFRGPSSTILPETQRRLFGILVSLGGRGSPGVPLEGRAPRFYLGFSRLTVVDGTSEIQCNIIATPGLGMLRG